MRRADGSAALLDQGSAPWGVISRTIRRLKAARPVLVAMWIAGLLLCCGQAACQRSEVGSVPSIAEQPRSIRGSESPSSSASRPIAARTAALPAEVAALVDGLARNVPSSAESLLAQGKILELFEHSGEAIWCWEECVALDPGHAPAYEQLGLVALKQGNFDQAVDWLRKACDLDSELLSAHLKLGQALLRLDRCEEARVVLEHVVLIQPGSAEGWFELGQAQFHLEQYQQALQCYEAALHLHSDYGPAWFGVAQACERLGDRTRAQESRTRFVQLDDEHKQSERTSRHTASNSLDGKILGLAHGVAGDFYAAQEQSAAAERCWRRAAECDKSNVPSRQALAQALTREDRLAEAAAVWNELRELQPENVEHLFQLAILHEQLQEPAATERWLVKAAEIAPSDPRVFSALAVFYLGSGKRAAEALRFAQRLVQLEPSAENYFILSAAYRANSDRSRGRAALEEALRRDPGNPQYTRAAAAWKVE